VHRFQIVAPATSGSCTKVLYNSRGNVDKIIEHIRKTGSLQQFTFGQKRDPCQSLFKKVMTVFTLPQNVDSNIGVTLSVNLPGFESVDGSASGTANKHASGIQNLWAKTDASVLKRLDPETLEPIGVARQTVLHSDLTGQFSAAHAKTDPETGDVFNYNLRVGGAAVYRVFRVSASTGKTTVLAKITDAEGAYLHSLAISRNYVILCVWSAHYAYSGMKFVWERNVLDSMAPFSPSKPAKWYVIDKNGAGVVARYESEPFFCFHTINAWEEPRRQQQQAGAVAEAEAEAEAEADASASDDVDLFVDVGAYENMDILKRFYYNNLISTSAASRAYTDGKGDSSRPYWARWRLPAVKSGAPPHTARQALEEWKAPRSVSGELSVINPAYLTRPHRYVWAVSDRGQATFFDGLVKFDAHTRTAVHWQRHGHSPSEAIFIADPQGREEDDGVLLSVVLDGTRGHSYLLCLDAKTLAERGRASMDSVVAFGFHGAHVPAKVGFRALDT
jgi:torulene dioxygenase